MLRLLEKHPIIYGVIVVVIFLFWTFPPWLAAVWPLFSSEPFPVWLTKQGWYGMSLYFSALLLAVSTLSTLGLLVAILHAVREHTREIGWLKALAEEDSKNMTQLVFSENHTLSVIPHLNTVNPYVIFCVCIFNSSVYTLTLEEKIDRGFTFRKDPLPDQAQIYWEKNSIPKVEIKHGERCSFALRQWLPKNVIDFMQPRGRGEFQADSLALWFTYRDHAGVSQHIRVEIKGAINLELPGG